MDDNSQRWEILHDGIPEWIKEPVLDWFHRVYYAAPSYSQSRGYRQIIIRVVEVHKRIDIDTDLEIDTSSWPSIQHSLQRGINEVDQTKLIIFMDLTIQYVRRQTNMPYGEKPDMPSATILSDLENLLSKGSKWQVVTDTDARAGLNERVDSVLIAEAKAVGSSHLTKAWNEAFAVQPDPERAVEDAQKAIEELATKHGLSKATTKVLGNLISDVQKNPGKFDSVAHDAFSKHDELAKKPQGINDQFAQWLAQTMDFVQKSNPAHHASEATKDFKLDPRAAQQAVLMATLVCSMISKGFVYRVN